MSSKICFMIQRCIMICILFIITHVIRVPVAWVFSKARQLRDFFKACRLASFDLGNMTVLRFTFGTVIHVRHSYISRIIFIYSSLVWNVVFDLIAYFVWYSKKLLLDINIKHGMHKLVSKESLKTA